MACCGEREKGSPVALEEQWDYVNLDDFKSESCLSPFSYFFLVVLLFVSIAVYGVDTFTAVTLLAFSRWAGQIEPAIPFEISRWIFAVCILFSFALLGYRWLRAIRAIRSGSIAQSYLDSLAARVQSVRVGSHGRGWRRFLVFAELTKSKKGAEYVALFAYFSFESWMNTLLADGPRQVVNAITLYSVMRMDLLPGGENAVEEKNKAAILQFFDNVRILAEENNLRALVLAGMLFTLFIWVLSIIKLALAIILYLIFLFHHIPSEDGTLKAYCRRKINSRLTRIVRRKVNKALAKGVALKDRTPTNPNLAVDRNPTLPTFGDGDKTPIVSTISRSTTQTTLATLPPSSSHPGTAALQEREPTLPDLGAVSDKLMLTRTATQSSAYSESVSLSGTTAASAYSPLDRQTSPAPPVPPLPNIAAFPASRSQTPMSRSTCTPAPSVARGPPSRMGSAAGSRHPMERPDPYSPEGYDDPRSGTPFGPYSPAVDPYTRSMTPGTAISPDTAPNRILSPTGYNTRRPPPTAYPQRSFTPGGQAMDRGSPAYYPNEEEPTRTFSPFNPINTRQPPPAAYPQRSFTPAGQPADHGSLVYSNEEQPNRTFSPFNPINTRQPPPAAYPQRSFTPAGHPVDHGSPVYSNEEQPNRTFSPFNPINTRQPPPAAYPQRSFTPAGQFADQGSPVYSNEEQPSRTFSPVSSRAIPRPQDGYAAFNPAARNTPAPRGGPGYVASSEYDGEPPGPAYSSPSYTPQPTPHRQDH